VHLPAERDAVAAFEADMSRLMGGRTTKSVFWLCFEGAHCAILFAAVVMLFLYVFRDSRTARFASV
jgi:hypothetical protein